MNKIFKFVLLFSFFFSSSVLWAKIPTGSSLLDEWLKKRPQKGDVHLLYRISFLDDSSSKSIYLEHLIFNTSLSSLKIDLLAEDGNSLFKSQKSLSDTGPLPSLGSPLGALLYGKDSAVIVRALQKVEVSPSDQVARPLLRWQGSILWPIHFPSAGTEWSPGLWMKKWEFAPVRLLWRDGSDKWEAEMPKYQMSQGALQPQEILLILNGKPWVSLKQESPPKTAIDTSRGTWSAAGQYLDSKKREEISRFFEWTL